MRGSPPRRPMPAAHHCVRCRAAAAAAGRVRLRRGGARSAAWWKARCSATAARLSPRLTLAKVEGGRPPGRPAAAAAASSVPCRGRGRGRGAGRGRVWVSGPQAQRWESQALGAGLRTVKADKRDKPQSASARAEHWSHAARPATGMPLPSPPSLSRCMLEAHAQQKRSWRQFPGRHPQGSVGRRSTHSVQSVHAWAPALTWVEAMRSSSSSSSSSSSAAAAAAGSCTHGGRGRQQ